MPNKFISMQIKCSVCGTSKGDTNHWWAVVPNVMNTGGFPEKVVRLQLCPLSSVDLHADSLFPACGSGCVDVLVNRYLRGEELYQTPEQRGEGPRELR